MWPKNFPNPDFFGSTGRPLLPTDPQWRPVAGKSGIYIHDDVPTQEVEIILFQCPVCEHEQQTMHSVSVLHGLATAIGRKDHSTCPNCPNEQKLKPINLEQSKLGKRNQGGHRW